MFDRTIIRQSPSHIFQDVTVKEIKAPTDASVRLLREMEAKAEAEVIKAVVVKDNLFSCVIHTMFDALSQQYNIKVICSINGKKIVSDYQHESFEEDWSTRLIDVVARDIAVEILRKPMEPALLALREWHKEKIYE